MSSIRFDKIKVKLQNHHPIYALYSDGTSNATIKRELCPHVLGYKKEDSDETQDVNERVLCYQLDGPGSAKGWRCFNLKLLEVLDDAPPPDHWVTPPDYKPKWQNVVQKPKHKV